MFDRRYRFLLALLVPLLLLHLPADTARRVKSDLQGYLAPLMNAVSSLVDTGRDVWAFLQRVRESAEEQERMNARLGELSVEVQRLREAERQNEELRRMLDFKRGSPHPLVACEVVARGDSSGWWQTITLNKGTEAGIAEDMPVLSVEGLVGRVIGAAPGTSTVLLISDRGFKAACRLERAGAFGILRGEGPRALGTVRMECLWPLEPLRIDYLFKDSRVADGDEVVTSGLGGVYPDGLRIGRVQHVETDRSRMYQRAQVVPAADLGRLRYVFVLVR